MMFGFHKNKKQKEKLILDPAEEKPVIRVSICTGEKTGCIRNIHTKKQRDVMLIRNAQDLQEFAGLTGTPADRIEEVM